MGRIVSKQFEADLGPGWAGLPADLRDLLTFLVFASEEDEEEEPVSVSPPNTTEEERSGAEEESLETENAGWAFEYTDM